MDKQMNEWKVYTGIIQTRYPLLDQGIKKALQRAFPVFEQMFISLHK